MWFCLTTLENNLIFSEATRQIPDKKLSVQILSKAVKIWNEKLGFEAKKGH